MSCFLLTEYVLGYIFSVSVKILKRRWDCEELYNTWYAKRYAYVYD